MSDRPMLERLVEILAQGVGLDQPSEAIVRELLAELRQTDEVMVAASGKALKRHIEALSPARRRQAVGTNGLRIKRGEKARLRFAAMIDAVLG